MLIDDKSIIISGQEKQIVSQNQYLDLGKINNFNKIECEKIGESIKELLINKSEKYIDNKLEQIINQKGCCCNGIIGKDVEILEIGNNSLRFGEFLSEENTEQEEQKKRLREQKEKIEEQRIRLEKQKRMVEEFYKNLEQTNNDILNILDKKIVERGSIIVKKDEIIKKSGKIEYVKKMEIINCELNRWYGILKGEYS